MRSAMKHSNRDLDFSFDHNKRHPFEEGNQNTKTAHNCGQFRIWILVGKTPKTCYLSWNILVWKLPTTVGNFRIWI